MKSIDHTLPTDLDIADGLSCGWTVEMIQDAKRKACDLVLKAGHRIGSCDLITCAGGAVRATSHDIVRGTFGHPKFVATVYRDGSVIAR